jgi:hypothetical protein
MKIKDHILLPSVPASDMTDNELITYIADQIKFSSDEAGLPLFKID